MTMPKVYIANKSGHDFTLAERYGSIRFLTEGHINRFNVNKLYRIIADGLSDSSGDDYLVITSLNIINALASAIFAAKHKRVNYLLFRNGEYVLRSIQIDALIKTED